MGECCSPTRTLKWLLTNDKKELLHFVSQLAELNPRRIVVNHGEIFEGEGGNQIRTSFALLFG
jgi:predicted metal-dependent RNase